MPSPDNGDYPAKVREAIASMRRKAGMTTDEFGAALSEELHRTIRGNKVTQWEKGTHLPKSDIFLASMAISGAEPKELGVDPRAQLAIRVNELQRRVREMEAQREGRTIRFPHRLTLPLAEGSVDDYLSASAAAVLLGLPRSQMYDLRNKGLLTAYRLGTRTVFRRAEVNGLQKRREKKKT